MKKIFFISLSRSDFATLWPIFHAAHSDRELDAQLIVGGSHFVKRFGDSYKDIAAKKIPYQELRFLNEADDKDQDLAVAYSRMVERWTQMLIDDRPDAVFMVGDRWELMGVATVCTMLRVPVLHHSGGDITSGSFDNQTRYAVSQLAHLHFVATEEHKQRLIFMGEEAWRISAVGEPALENLSVSATTSAQTSEFALATLHPSHLEEMSLPAQLEVFLESLREIPMNVVLTAPNPDAGSGIYYRAMKDFSGSHDHIRFVENLGSDYHAALNRAAFIIGNSSSGLLEAPTFHLPAINIGRRQEGRTRAKNVIDVPFDLAQIRLAVKQAIDPLFRKSLQSLVNPYVKPGGIRQIMATLKKDYRSGRLRAKKFIDPIQGRL